MTFGEIFIIGVVIILVCIIGEEFFEAYDEWRNGDED